MKSISDFAESLILGEVKDIQEGKAVSPSMATNTPQAAPAGKDIRDVKVPNSFMQEVLGEEFVPSLQEEVLPEPEEEEVIHLEEPQENNSLVISEGTINELVVLLKEVKELLSEMTMGTTSTGQIGVNLGGPGRGSKLRPQRGYPIATPSTLPSNYKRSSRGIFKDALKRRRRQR